MRKLLSTTCLPLALTLFAILPASFAFAATSDDSTDVNLQGELPRIDFVVLRQNFGDVIRGERKKAQFEFTNKGNGVLHIRSIHASCGCVETSVEPKDVFQPGEKGRIAFEFDSSFFAGKVVRTLTVDTNAPSPSTVTLTFTANVKEEISAKPSLLSLGEVSRGTDKELSTVVSWADKADGIDTFPRNFDKLVPDNDVKKVLQDGNLKDIRAVKVTTSSPLLTAELVPTKNGTKVVVKVKGNLPIGPFRERVSVWNTSRHLKELVIPVIGEVTGHVMPSAKYLEFGVVTKPNVVRRSLTLHSDNKGFKVNDVGVELRKIQSLKGVDAADIVKPTLEDAKGGGIVIHFDMQVPKSIEAQTTSINASGVFVVRTNDEDYKEIRVPFFGILRRE